MQERNSAEIWSAGNSSTNEGDEASVSGPWDKGGASDNPDGAIVQVGHIGKTQTRDLFACIQGHWPLDEGVDLTAADISGNGNDGTLFGPPNWITGVLGSGRPEFDQ